jgi:hypothetical protein
MTIATFRALVETLRGACWSAINRLAERTTADRQLPTDNLA